MKKYTKKFLNKELKPSDKDFLMYNANKAKRILGFSVNLWLELWGKHELIESIKKLDETQNPFYMAFMAGVVVGWAEKNNKIK
jgi:hypothetical protein